MKLTGGQYKELVEALKCAFPSEKDLKQMPLNTYSHVLPGMQQEGAEKLDRMLFQNNSIEGQVVNKTLN